jgi:DNA-binding winged helix-turn-helix (wHTH) protein/Flp pilus assembly protein TadD
MRSPSPQRVMRFDAFTVDLSRCVLLRGNAELSLRPKAFDMLCYLAEHPGRLITKDELFSAVWPGVTVGDDSLVRCVKDIREALGDREHSIVKTVRGRGYLFAAPVVAAEGSAAPGHELGRSPLLAVPSLLAAARSRLLPAGWQTLALVAAAIVAGAAGLWSLQTPSVASSAAHYAILGRSVLANERSAKANREALALFGKALAADPDWVPALLGYASVMIIEVGGEWVSPEERPVRLDQAEAAIERALKREPASAYAHQLMGVLLRMRGDPDRAAAAFERSLVLSPNNAWTLAEFGRTKIELGRADEALADIEAALRLRPSEAAIHVWYCWAGMAALHAGRNEQAVRWLLKAREARSTYPLPVPLLAVAYAETGRVAEGRSLLAEHLALAPGLTMLTVRADYPPHNPIVAVQRERIASVLRRLGVPDGPVRTGSTR